MPHAVSIRNPWLKRRVEPSEHFYREMSQGSEASAYRHNNTPKHTDGRTHTHTHTLEVKSQLVRVIPCGHHEKRKPSRSNHDKTTTTTTHQRGNQQVQKLNWKKQRVCQKLNPRESKNHSTNSTSHLQQ